MYRGQIKPIYGALVVLWSTLFACEKAVDDNVLSREREYYAGGVNTTFEYGSNAYAIPSRNLTGPLLQNHLAGDALFHANFQEDESLPFPGLGPLFIHHSCAACHAQNGRSHPPFSKDDNSSGLLLRLSLAGAGEYGEPIGVPGFGIQLQTSATNGTLPEANFFISWENVPVEFPDGHSVTLRQPYFQFYNTYTTLPPAVLRSGRNAPPVFGLGLLEAIPEADILALEDIADINEDYISGKANFVWNHLTQEFDLGRFGWKSGSPSVIQQSAEAFLQDMGITSAGIFPIEACLGQPNCTATPSIPDISFEQARQTAFYLRTLAVPAPRNLDDPTVIQGKQLFTDIGCASCHVPQWTTGLSDIPFLSNQLIYPYTDLLIHDLGEGLGDGRPEYEAGANEWRTPPLWGIGLSSVVSPLGTFLHDGRASTLEEAILWHGGEAVHTRNYFINLSADEREALIRFLKSL